MTKKIPHHVAYFAHILVEVKLAKKTKKKQEQQNHDCAVGQLYRDYYDVLFQNHLLIM